MLTSKQTEPKQPPTSAVLTSKRLIELNPVFEDEVAVVLSMPEAGFPVELSHACLQTADGVGVCEHSKTYSETVVQVGPEGEGSTLIYETPRLNFPSQDS